MSNVYVVLILNFFLLFRVQNSAAFLRAFFLIVISFWAWNVNHVIATCAPSNDISITTSIALV